MFYDGGAWMGGMHWLWWIFWIALVGAVVYAAWRRPDASGRPPQETPRQVLQRRLAGGEISIDEYEKRKALLDRNVQV